MRTLRWLLPALVAGAGWLASAGLELFGRQVMSGPQRELFAIVAPETIRVLQLTAPAPWAAVVIVLSAVGIASAFTVFAAIVRPEPSGPSDPSEPRSAGAALFAAYWFCSVLAGAAMGAIAVVSGVLTRAAYLGFGTEQFADAVRWGLAWGWIPALAAILLDRRVAGPLPSRNLLLAIAAGVFVATAVSLLAIQPRVDAAVTDASNAEAGAAAEVEPSEPVPTVTPLPLVAPGDWQIDPSWCTSGQLEFSAGRPDAFAGNRGMVVLATNVSGASCVLEGYPDLAFSDDVENPLDVQIDHGNSMAASDPGISRIEIPADGQAQITLGWGAMPTQGLESAGFLYVAAYAGAERQLVHVETDITGGSVTTTAWSLRAVDAGVPAAG